MQKKLVSFAGVLAMALSLAACNPTTPSQVEMGKMRVKENTVTETLDAGRIDQDRVSDISKKFLRYGHDEISLTVPYIAGGENAAGRLGEAYKKEFMKQGVANVALAYVPVGDKRDAQHVIAAYPAVAAVAAKDCGRIPGYQGTDNLDAMRKYQVGCEMQANIGKMIADPTDLLGKGPEPADTDSRRAAAATEQYNSGKPYKLIMNTKASAE